MKHPLIRFRAGRYGGGGSTISTCSTIFMRLGYTNHKPTHTHTDPRTWKSGVIVSQDANALCEIKSRWRAGKIFFPLDDDDKDEEEEDDEEDVFSWIVWIQLRRTLSSVKSSKVVIFSRTWMRLPAKLSTRNSNSDSKWLMCSMWLLCKSSTSNFVRHSRFSIAASLFLPNMSTRKWGTTFKWSIFYVNTIMMRRRHVACCMMMVDGRRGSCMHFARMHRYICRNAYFLFSQVCRPVDRPFDVSRDSVLSRLVRRNTVDIVSLHVNTTEGYCRLKYISIRSRHGCPALDQFRLVRVSSYNIYNLPWSCYCTNPRISNFPGLLNCQSV